MKNEQLNKELAIQISESEYATLNFMAQRMEIPINDVVRGLIPRFSSSKAPEATPLTIPMGSIPKTGPFKICEDLNKSRLAEICDELIDKRMAKTLGDEIKEQVIDDEGNRDILNMTTERRLLRWAHPLRIDNRTRFATPRAKEICMILFGFIPERED